MEHFTNFFELHVGFSTALGDSVVTQFTTQMCQKDRDWTRSVVRSVHLTQPGCFDPHNVPGTLGWLVSRKIFQSTSGWKKTIDDAVLQAANRALCELSELGAADARLEIEFPFGCFAATVVDGTIFRSAWTNDPVSIPTDKLVFHAGQPMNEVPQWEIHFLLERIPESAAAHMTPQEISAFVARHGVDVEQTIEYRSAAMVEAGRIDYRLIATAYFPDAPTTLKEGERLFYHSGLCQEAFEHGYTVRLILEHIVTCLQPNPKGNRTTSATKTNCSEVSCAK
jgi:hypothetical protein